MIFVLFKVSRSSHAASLVPYPTHKDLHALYFATNPQSIDICVFHDIVAFQCRNIPLWPPESKSSRLSLRFLVFHRCRDPRWLCCGRRRGK